MCCVDVGSSKLNFEVVDITLMQLIAQRAQTTQTVIFHHAWHHPWHGRRASDSAVSEALCLGRGAAVELCLRVRILIAFMYSSCMSQTLPPSVSHVLEQCLVLLFYIRQALLPAGTESCKGTRGTQ